MLRVTGYRVPGAGYRFLVTGFWLPDSGKTKSGIQSIVSPLQ
jgi:hypothetical protein